MKNTLPVLLIIFAALIFCWVYASASSTIGPPGYYTPVLVRKLLKQTAEPDKWKKINVPHPRFDGHTGREVYHSEYPTVSHDHHTGYRQSHPLSRPHIIKILHYPVTFEKVADSKLEQDREDKLSLSFYNLTGIYLTPELNETLSKLFPLCPLLKEIILAAPYDKPYEDVKTESSTDFEEYGTTKSYNYDYNSSEEEEGPDKKTSFREEEKSFSLNDEIFTKPVETESVTSKLGEAFPGDDHGEGVTRESDERTSFESGKEERPLSTKSSSDEIIQPLSAESDEFEDAPSNQIETDIKNSSEHDSSEVLPTKSNIDDTLTSGPKSSEKQYSISSDQKISTQPISEEISIISLTGSKEYIEDSVIMSTEESAFESPEYDYIVITESEYNKEDSSTLSTVISEDLVTETIVYKYELRNDSEAVSESKSSEEQSTETVEELRAKSEEYEPSTSSGEYGSATTTIGSKKIYEDITSHDEIESSDEPSKEFTSKWKEYDVTEKFQKDEGLQTSTELATTESDKYEDSSDKNEEKSIEEETSISLILKSEQDTTTPITYSYNDSSSEAESYKLSSEEADEFVASETDESIEEQSTKSSEEFSTESEEFGIPSTEIIEIGAAQKSTNGPSFYDPEYEDETHKEDSITLESGELESSISTVDVSGILTTETISYEDTEKDEKTAETSEGKVSTLTTEFVVASDEDLNALRHGPSNKDIIEEATTEPQENEDFSTTSIEGVTITGMNIHSTSDKNESSEESTRSDSYDYNSEERSTTLSNLKIFVSHFTGSDEYVDISSKSSSLEETTKEFSTQPDEYADISTEGIRSTLKSDVFTTTKMYTEVNELDFNDEPINKSSEEYDSRSTEKMEKESEKSEEVSSEELSEKPTTELNSIEQTTSSTDVDTSKKEKETRLKKLEDSNEQGKDLDGSDSSERVTSKMSTDLDEYEKALNEKQTILPIGELPTVSYEYFDMATEKIRVDNERKITEGPSSDSYEYENESSGEESSREESGEKATTTSGQSVSATATKYRDEPETSVGPSFTSSERMESTEELTTEHDQDYGKINEIISKSSETYDADQSITEKQENSSESNESGSTEIETLEKHDKKEKCPKAAAKFLEWLKSHYNDKKHELSMPEEFEKIAWKDIFGKNGDQVQCPYTTKTVLVLPDLASCNQFYYCVKGVAYNQKCPDGLKFNVLKMHCDFAHNVHCFS